jgi:hypothetical protein
MPKRSINLFNDADDHEDHKILDLFTEEEIMDNEEVSNFIIDNHYTNFLIKLEDPIANAFNFLGRYHNAPNFLPDHQDLGCLFTDLIYKHINKKYDFELLDLNPHFAKPLFKPNLKGRKKIVKEEIIIQKTQNKKFDWVTKTYK